MLLSLHVEGNTHFESFQASYLQCAFHLQLCATAEVGHRCLHPVPYHTLPAQKPYRGSLH